jgi:hypothetical protein
MSELHAPAPWNISKEEGMPIVDAKGNRVCDMDVTGNGCAHVANMRLIKTAPELLASLETVMEWIRHWDVPFQDDPDWNVDKQVALASIEKARGKS